MVSEGAGVFVIVGVGSGVVVVAINTIGVSVAPPPSLPGVSKVGTNALLVSWRGGDSCAPVRVQAMETRVISAQIINNPIFFITGHFLPTWLPIS
jgi:hypothetical protein